MARMPALLHIVAKNVLNVNSKNNKMNYILCEKKGGNEVESFTS